MGFLGAGGVGALGGGDGVGSEDGGGEFSLARDASARLLRGAGGGVVVAVVGHLVVFGVDVGVEARGFAVGARLPLADALALERHLSILPRLDGLPALLLDGPLLLLVRLVRLGLGPLRGEALGADARVGRLDGATPALGDVRLILPRRLASEASPARPGVRLRASELHAAVVDGGYARVVVDVTLEVAREEVGGGVHLEKGARGEDVEGGSGDALHLHENRHLRVRLLPDMRGGDETHRRGTPRNSAGARSTRRASSSVAKKARSSASHGLTDDRNRLRKISFEESSVGPDFTLSHDGAPATWLVARDERP